MVDFRYLLTWNLFSFSYLDLLAPVWLEGALMTSNWIWDTVSFYLQAKPFDPSFVLNVLVYQYNFQSHLLDSFDVVPYSANNLSQISLVFLWNLNGNGKLTELLHMLWRYSKLPNWKYLNIFFNNSLSKGLNRNL